MDDSGLESTVIEQLKADPTVRAGHIGVDAHAGVVTLSGRVDSHMEKAAAEAAARRASGVRAIVEQIDVRPFDDRRTSDELIAARAIAVLSWSASVPDGIVVKVEDGWITLNGRTERQAERLEAAQAVNRLKGVAGVTNLIELSDAGMQAEVVDRVVDALKRDACLDLSTIRITLEAGGRVILEGRVRAAYEKGLAERAAQSVTGIREIVDRLVVEG